MTWFNFLLVAMFVALAFRLPLLLLCDGVGGFFLSDHGLHIPSASLAGLTLSATPSSAKPPDQFGTWWPRWMIQAAERMDQLVRRGCSPQLLQARLRLATSSRGDDCYSVFSNGVGADLLASTTPSQATSIPAELEDDVNAWVLYAEEAMLVEHLEAHYPACMRQLWNHIAQGGLFADHLPVNDMMIYEGVYNFNIIREWNHVLDSLLPNGKHRATGENRWLQVLEQWLWDTRDELEQLLLAGWDGPSLLQGLLARSGIRGCSPYNLIVRDVVIRLSSELGVGDGPAAPMTHAAWAVHTETRLYALYVQHGGSTATSSSVVESTPATSGNTSSSSCSPPLGTSSLTEGLPNPQEQQEEVYSQPASLPSTGVEANLETPLVPDTSSSGMTSDLHHDEHEEEGQADTVSLMAKQGVNKRWLKSRSRSRAQRDPRHRPARVPVEPRDPPPHRHHSGVTETRESVDLSRCVRPRARATPNPGEAPSSSSRRSTGHTPSYGAGDGQLTLQDATQLWLLWLGITDENNESPRGRLLPPFVEEVVSQSFLSFGVRDRLTLALGFTHLIQSLLASIGRLIEESCAKEDVSAGSGGTPANTTGDGDGEDTDETMSMQTTDMEWYRLLHELRAAFEKQTKDAMLQNVRWLRRLLHHRCVDSTSGQLLGLLRGHEGEIVALLAGAEADAGDVESPDTKWCTTWCSEWFRRMMPFLPVARGSLAALGRNPLNQDPLPCLLRVPEIPSDLLESGSESPAPQMLQGPPRGPPKPLPVHGLATTGPLPGPDPGPQPPSPTESQLDAAAAQMEAEAMAQEQAHEESLEDKYYENLVREHESAACQDWDDWAMYDSLHNPQPSRKRVLKVMLQGGADDQKAEVEIPLHHGHPVELRLQVTVGFREEPVAVNSELSSEAEPARGSNWNLVSSLDPSRLQDLYLRWRAGLISSQEVAREFGPSILEALHAEHLIYMNGAAFYAESARLRDPDPAGPSDTALDGSADGSEG